MIRASVDIGIAILAAGKSQRMGTSKLTMPFASTTLLERSLQTALESKVEQVVVVTGSHRKEAKSIIEKYPSVTEIYNARWAQGQSTSVIAAVEHGKDVGYEALLLMVADQPFVQADHLNSLIGEYRKSRALACVPRVGTRDGSPCLFSRRSFAELLTLRGDKGARSVYRHWPEEQVSYVSFKDPHLFYDVDTPEDMLNFKKMLGGEFFE